MGRSEDKALMKTVKDKSGKGAVYDSVAAIVKKTLVLKRNSESMKLAVI